MCKRLQGALPTPCACQRTRTCADSSHNNHLVHQRLVTGLDTMQRIPLYWIRQCCTSTTRSPCCRRQRLMARLLGFL
jgi:hypothetical protein